MMKKLLNTSVAFVGAVRRCQPWTVLKLARQCSTCLRWGHSAYVCRSTTPTCIRCAGDHPTTLHSLHATQCRTQRCTHTSIKCINCHQAHLATDAQCPFFLARSSPQKLLQLQAQRKTDRNNEAAARRGVSRRSRRTGAEGEEG